MNYSSVFLLVQANLSYLALGAGVLLVTVLVIMLVQGARLRSLGRRVDRLLAGGSGSASLEEMVVASQVSSQGALAEMGVVSRDLGMISGRLESSLQRVGLFRFDAFPGMGGELSFALALLDEGGNGVVLTSLYGRDESRIFAKSMGAGKSSHPLSGEEERAIAMAMSEKNNGKSRKK